MSGQKPFVILRSPSGIFYTAPNPTPDGDPTDGGPSAVVGYADSEDEAESECLRLRTEYLSRRVTVKARDIEDIPIGSNPFHHDLSRMGTPLVRDWMVMHEGYDSADSPLPMSHLILVNLRSGQRIRLDLIPQEAPTAFQPEVKITSTLPSPTPSIIYPDADNPDWEPWVEVDPSIDEIPTGINIGDLVQFQMLVEREGLEWLPWAILATREQLSAVFGTQSVDGDSAIVAYRVKKAHGSSLGKKGT